MIYLFSDFGIGCYVFKIKWVLLGWVNLIIGVCWYFSFFFFFFFRVYLKENLVFFGCEYLNRMNCFVDIFVLE